METDPDKKKKRGETVTPEQAEIVEFEGTTVDLGEDLLRTRKIPDLLRQQLRDPEPEPESGPDPEREPELKKVARPSPAPAPVNDGVLEEKIESADEEMQRGEILMREGLLHDAKRVFWKLLRLDPANVIARKHLEKIDHTEVRELLSGDSPRKRVADLQAKADDPKSVMERFEKELGINVERPAVLPVPDLFQDQGQLQRYGDRMVRRVIKLPPRDRMDIGVAYLEMGLHEVAQKIFESVVRYEDHKIAGMYLLGMALIQGGKAIEATIRLEPIVRDASLSDGDRADFLYLMGRAFEALNETHKARDFYRRVHTLNPRYRDVVDRLK